MNCKYYILVFWVALFAACSSKSNQDAIAEGGMYFTRHIEKFVIKTDWNEVEHQKQLMRHAAKENDFMLLHYYLLMLNDGAGEKNLDKSLLYIDSLEQLYPLVNKDFQKAFEVHYINSLCQKASIVFAQNKYYQAYDLYYNVKNWHEHNRQPVATNHFLFTMGISSYEQKLYDKAAFFFKKQLDNLVSTPKTDTILEPHYRYYFTQQTFNNIGLSYTKLNKLDSAESYCKQGLQFIEAAKNGAIKNYELHNDHYNVCLAVTIGNLAKIYALQGKTDDAIAAYKKSIYLTLDVPQILPSSSRDTLDACVSMIQLAELYYTIKDEKQFKETVQKVNTIVSYNLLGHGFFINNGYVLGSLKVNYWYNTMQKNDKAALYYLNRYVSYKDSIELVQKEGKDRNLIQALEIKGKEDEVNKLKLTSKIDRLYLLGIVLIAIVIAFVAFLFYRSNKKEKQTNKLLSTLNNEIKQQQKETAFAHEQALEANKDKDKILHIVAHDLRNPLTGIATLADIMLEDVEEAKQQNILKTISSSSKRATQLVNELVSNQYNKQQQLSLEIISLNKLVQQILPLFKHKADQKNIQLKQILPPNEIIVLADWAKLERVVNNLLHNAIKFTSIGGSVQVVLEVKNEKVLIHINDSGIGMSNEILKGLTNAKSTLVRAGTNGEKSYGLGWNICKQIVEAHNGKLYIESKENIGTTVSIEFAITTNA